MAMLNNQRVKHIEIHPSFIPETSKTHTEIQVLHWISRGAAFRCADRPEGPAPI